MARLAEGQGGVVSRRQLQELGLGGTAIARWLAAGHLHPLYRGVFAVGHRAVGIEGRLRGALLYAGDHAALSFTTAGWQWGLLSTQPKRIHISVAGRRKSLREVAIHRVSYLQATRHRTLPVTTVPRTLLDLAATLPFPALRRALAEADYRGLLDTRAIEAELGRGRPGSAALRQALQSHLPELGEVRSPLEERFLLLCEQAGLPPPEVNAAVEGLTVDAAWRHAQVIVELDGAEAHATPERMRNDRRRDLTLRSVGYTVLRYTWGQVMREPLAVVGDVRGALERRSA